MAEKFSDEQLALLSQAGFTAEEIVLFQHNPSYAPSREELEALTTVRAVSENLSELPKNMAEVFEVAKTKYGIVLDGEIPQAELEKRVKMLAKKDPELAKHLALVYTFVEFIEDDEE